MTCTGASVGISAAEAVSAKKAESSQIVNAAGEIREILVTCSVRFD
jgi:hypothetical protein